jgi:hypothetical protein
MDQELMYRWKRNSKKILEQTVNCSSDSYKKNYDEYKDLSDSVRHYNTHFIALLTILFAVTAGLFRVEFGEETSITNLDRLVVALIGFIVSILFYSQGEIYLRRQWVFERRLVKLENLLKYEHYSKYSEVADDESRSYWSLCSGGRWAWRLFFIGFLLLWSYSFIRVVVGRAGRERAPERYQELQLLWGNSARGKREADVRFVLRDGRPKSSLNISGDMRDTNRPTAEVPTMLEAMGKVDLVRLSTGKAADSSIGISHRKYPQIYFLPKRLSRIPSSVVPWISL